MKSYPLLIVVVVSAAVFAACNYANQPPTSVGGMSVEHAFEQHARDVQVEAEGVVDRILSDDRSGSPHQRIIVRLSSGQTVLIEHNIELAPRVNDLHEGDSIGFYGEYVWNTQGGIVHWTHHDPAGRHIAGWLKHNGRTYQ